MPAMIRLGQEECAVISTVTTTTVTTVTSAGLAGTLALVAITTLMVLLVQKELVSISPSPRARSLSQRLNVAIIPLAMAFTLVAVVSIASIFQ